MCKVDGGKPRLCPGFYSGGVRAPESHALHQRRPDHALYQGDVIDESLRLGLLPEPRPNDE